MLVFFGFLLACVAVSAIAGAATSSQIESWYRPLAKPSFNPPDWIFAPVWTVLYFAMAVAAWRVWRAAASTGTSSGAALAAWWAQLALNFAWSLLFFWQGWLGVAFAEIIVLLAAIATTIVLFWRIDRLGAGLLVPYAAWVSFASVLNWSIWMLNP